jgi:hypothetical protein
MRQVQAVEEALRETRRRPHAWPLSHGTLGPPEHPDRQLLRRHPRYHARARADRAVALAAVTSRGALYPGRMDPGDRAAAERPPGGAPGPPALGPAPRPRRDRETGLAGGLAPGPRGGPDLARRVGGRRAGLWPARAAQGGLRGGSSTGAGAARGPVVGQSYTKPGGLERSWADEREARLSLRSPYPCGKPDGDGGSRTHTRVTPQRCLRPPRLPFRHVPSRGPV